jgi:hypothetical protein
MRMKVYSSKKRKNKKEKEKDGTTYTPRAKGGYGPPWFSIFLYLFLLSFIYIYRGTIPFPGSFTGIE